MKKFLLVLALAVTVAVITTPPAHAQIVKQLTLTKATLTGTDTAYGTLNVDATFKSVEVNVTKTGSSPAGKVYLIAQVINNNWDKLDSLTFTNIAGLQRRVLYIPVSLGYVQYKLQYICAGGNASIAAYPVRRN